MKLTTTILGAVLTAVCKADDGGECQEPTGIPFRNGEPIDLDCGLESLAPAEITWSTDRGNWMWDGVLATLRAMGVDTSKPIEML